MLTRASNGYLRHGLCLLVLRDECRMPSAHGHLQAHPLGMVFPIEYLSCPLLQRNHHVDGYITTLITCKSGVFRSPRSLRASSCRSSASATRETSVSSPARTKGEGIFNPRAQRRWSTCGHGRIHVALVQSSSEMQNQPDVPSITVTQLVDLMANGGPKMFLFSALFYDRSRAST